MKKLLKKMLKVFCQAFELFEEKSEGVICPECFGKGTTVIHARPNRTPDPMDTFVQCPICHGTGRVPEYVRKRDEL